MKLNKKTKKAANIANIVFGVLGTAIGIFTYSIPLGIGVVVGCILLCVIINFVIPQDNLPNGMDSIAEEFGNSPVRRAIKVNFPCDSAYYNAANKLAKEKFGKNSVSTKIVNDWKKRNEYILTCVSDNNKLVGYFDILPLKTDFAQKLVSGEVGEKEIRAEHIMGVHEMKEAEYIYFAGIAVQDTNSGRGYIHATYMVCAAMVYIQLFYGSSKLKKIITIPTTDCGLKIAEHLQFSLEREGNLRKDGFDLYSQNYDKESMTKMIRDKKDVYKRFDINSYVAMYEKMSGKTGNLPYNLNFVRG